MLFDFLFDLASDQGRSTIYTELMSGDLAGDFVSPAPSAYSAKVGGSAAILAFNEVKKISRKVTSESTQVTEAKAIIRAAKEGGARRVTIKLYKGAGYKIAAQYKGAQVIAEKSDGTIEIEVEF